MSYLKLHRDEPETEAPAPIPFQSSQRSWRQAGAQPQDEQEIDSIAHVENALARVDEKFDELSGQVEELLEPIPMSRWLHDEEDDGPWVA